MTMWLRNVVDVLRLNEEVTRQITATPQERVRLLNHSDTIKNLDCPSFGVSNDCAVKLLIDAGKAERDKKRALLLMCRDNAMNHNIRIWVRLIT